MMTGLIATGVAGILLLRSLLLAFLSLKPDAMPDFLQLTKDRLLPELLVWVTLIAAMWLSNSWMRKAVAALLWQWYDLFIGKPP